MEDEFKIEAEAIIAEIGGVSVVEYRPNTGEILLDANLSLKELRAIVWWAEHRPSDPIPSVEGPNQHVDCAHACKELNIHMIPVTERLPDYEVEVLSTNGKYWNVVERVGTKKNGEIWKLCEDGKDDTKETDRLDVEVKYWSPLPDAKRYAK